jgi:ribonuclease Z
LKHPGGSRGFLIEMQEQSSSLVSGKTLASGGAEEPAASALPLMEKMASTTKRIAYITDTVADGSYVEFIRGADVLIHECNFPDEMSHWCEQTGHSHTSAVARIAKEAGVKRLYLTHIDPQRPDDDPVGMETARAIFPETILAEDLMEIEV